MKIQELQNKQDSYIIQDPLVVTVRKAYDREQKAGNYGDYVSQGLEVSDDTGTMRLYANDCEPFAVGDQIEICAVKSQKGGMVGAQVKRNQAGSPFIKITAKGYRIAGVRRPPAPPLDDPEWLSGDAQPPQQQRTQARPQQQALPMQQQARTGSSQQGPARRNSIQAVKMLVEMTEQAYNSLADSSVTGVSCDALFEAAQKLATSLWISIDKNQLDYVEPPQEKPIPPPAQDGPEDLAPDLDWGYPEEVS